MKDLKRLKEHLNNGKTEFVMCSAIHYDDGVDHINQPFNIETGYVICGWRHFNCRSPYGHLKGVQGFLTTKNRFLDRE